MSIQMIVLKVFLFMFFGYLNWRLFNIIKKDSINRKKTINVKEKKSKYTKIRIFSVSIIILLILSSMAFLVYPISYQSFFYTYSYSFFVIFFVLLLIPFFSMIFFSVEYNKSFRETIKAISSKYIYYLLPLILSTISNFILLNFYDSNMEEITIFNFRSIIEFQKNHYIVLFGYDIPAIFLIINPLSFITYLSSIIGFFRQSSIQLNAGFLFDEKSQSIFNQNRLLDFSYSMFLYLSIIPMIPLFLGNLWFSESGFINLSITIFFSILFVIIISYYGKGKPKTMVDKKVGKFQSVPLFLSLISIIYSFFISYLPIY